MRPPKEDERATNHGREWSAASLNGPGQSTERGPRVTVVIPTYNHFVYLQQAIDSVLRQTLQDFEVVVVDDGSTDPTPRFIPQYHEKVRYIRQSNQGLAAARNTGIDQARGAVIALLDADDLYEPDFLETMTRSLFQTGEKAAVYCGYRFVDEANRPLPYSSDRVVPPHRLFETLAAGNFLVPAAVVADKRCYQAAGPFDSRMDACADWDMWLQFAKGFLFRGVREKLVRYRVLTSSMSSDPQVMLLNREAVLAKHFSTRCGEILGRRAYAETYLRTAVEYLQRQDRQSALYYLRMMSARFPPILNTDRIYYELACGIQPRGFSGDVETLNLEDSEEILSELVSELFRDANPILQRYHRQAWAKACLALAKLAYRQRRFRRVRVYLARASKADFGITARKQFLSLLFKSIVQAHRTTPGSTRGRAEQR